MASLGDNITALAVRRHLRRLPAAGQAGVRRRRAAHARVADAGQLDQPGPAAAAGLLLLRAAALGGRARAPLVSVPSGNFGNLTAGLIAKRLGLPVRQFVAATNVNDAVPALSRLGPLRARPSVRTVANAMDVGAPSNFERMQAMYGGDLEALRRDVAGFAYDDARVVAEIAASTASTATCSTRTAPSPGWRCNDALSQRSRTRTACSWPPRIRPSSARWSSRRSARPCRCRRALAEALRAARGTRMSTAGRLSPRLASACLSRRRPTRMPPLDAYRPGPGDPPARDADPDRVPLGPDVDLRELGRVVRPATRELETRDRRRSSAFQGTLGQGRRALLDGVPRDGRDGRAELPRLVLRGAAVRRGSAQQRRSTRGGSRCRSCSPGSSRRAPGSTPSCWRFRSRRFAAGWTADAELAVYRFAIESLFHEQEHVLDETGRAAAVVLPAASTACRTTATRR